MSLHSIQRNSLLYNRGLIPVKLQNHLTTSLVETRDPVNDVSYMTAQFQPLQGTVAIGILMFSVALQKRIQTANDISSNLRKERSRFKKIRTDALAGLSNADDLRQAEETISRLENKLRSSQTLFQIDESVLFNLRLANNPEESQQPPARQPAEPVNELVSLLVGIFAVLPLLWLLSFTWTDLLSIQNF